MAFDGFLKLEGIPGSDAGNVQAGLADFMVILSISWGLHRLTSVRITKDAAEDEPAEFAQTGRIIVTKLFDLSSPSLIGACNANKRVKTGEIRLFRTKADGSRFMYCKISLKDIIIAGVSLPFSPESGEVVELDPAFIEITYFSTSRSGPSGQSLVTLDTLHRNA